ncbi:MAG: cytochrome [Deltaproteobacteria bacterium]|nr:cytochrome [Deltaproteobacteria bacterium]
MAESASTPPTPPPFGGLQAIFPQLVADPYPFYAMLRGSNPVLRVPIPDHEGAGLWALTRHADVQQVLRDPRFSVNRLKSDLVRDRSGLVPAELFDNLDQLRSMLIVDDPDHTRLRDQVKARFLPRAVAALRGRIQDIVDELLGGVEGDRMDIVDELAVPLPAIVIAELLGVPVEDRARFKQWSTELLSVLGGTGDRAEGIARFRSALGKLIAYLAEIVEQRRREPRDDLLSEMVQAEREQALTAEELLANANVLLIAGHETTTNLIGNGMLALLQNPEQLELLRSDPALMPAAIDELLRYDSPVQATVRVALADVELGEHVVQKGALVACFLGAANRDPEVFPEPDRLDITRDAQRHLAFGFGAHFCLGSRLARLEGTLALQGLLDRHAQLRLTGEKLEYRPSPFLRGLKALPVAL